MSADDPSYSLNWRASSTHRDALQNTQAMEKCRQPWLLHCSHPTRISNSRATLDFAQPAAQPASLVCISRLFNRIRSDLDEAPNLFCRLPSRRSCRLLHLSFNQDGELETDIFLIFWLYTWLELISLPCQESPVGNLQSDTVVLKFSA